MTNILCFKTMTIILQYAPINTKVVDEKSKNVFEKWLKFDGESLTKDIVFHSMSGPLPREGGSHLPLEIF